MYLFIWLGLTAVFLLIEWATYTLSTIWFAGGSVAALLVACFWPDAIVIQAGVFVVVSGLLLVLLRPLARKRLQARRTNTNADRMLDLVGIVAEEIDNVSASGVVQVGGQTWSARSVTGDVIPKGTRVKAQRIEGVKLIVAPVVEV